MDATTTTEESVKLMKVSEIKKELTARGLATNGIKSALQKRLLEAIAAEPAAEEPKEDAMETEEPTEAATEATELPDLDDGAVYKGTVKYFRNSCYALVTPEADLKSVGLKGNAVKISASQILSSESPAVLSKGQEVEFKLKRDEWGVYGHSLTGPAGASVGLPEGYEPRTYPDRTVCNDGQVYTGTVKTFMWAQGFGFITFDRPEDFVAPEITDKKAAKKFEANEIWFARSDICSTDAAVGVRAETKVRFQLYTDEKGIGAQQIKPEDAEVFSGVDAGLKRGPPKKKKQRKQNKRKANQVGNQKGGFQMPMNGMPMNMAGCQMVMMNGQAFMMMPMPSAMMGGPNKKRKKNKNKRNKKKKAAAAAAAASSAEEATIAEPVIATAI